MYENAFSDCSNNSFQLINCGAARIETIRAGRIRSGDGLVDKLVDGLTTIKCNKNFL